MTGVGGAAPEASLRRRRPRATTRSLDRADRNKVVAPLDDDAEESQRTTGSPDRSSSNSIKVPHRRRDGATTNNTTSRRTRTTALAPTMEDVEDPPSLLDGTTFADVGSVGYEKEHNTSRTKPTTAPDPSANPRPPALLDPTFEEDDDDRDDDDEDDDNNDNDEHEQKEEPATTMDGTADGAGSKKSFPLDASPPDCAETTLESGTVDDSLFSDRYSLTVSHHQKVTCIVKPHNRHATAVQQLRQTRNEHRQQQPKAQDHIATSSGSSTSWSASSDEAMTFLGNLRTVVADLSYFFDSLKESLTEPHNMNPCSFTTPTEISYQRRRRHRHRQKTMKPQRSHSRSRSRSDSRKR
jgi:hypothetical protein